MMQHPSELRLLDTLPVWSVEGAFGGKGRQERGTRGWLEENTCRRENGSSSNWQNELIGNINLFNLRLPCEKEWNFWNGISGSGEKSEGGRKTFGNDDKRGRKMKFKLASLDSDDFMVTWQRAFMADTESISCLFWQRSERRSRCWIVTGTASSPNRSWVWPCALWVTCPARWSWPSSCRD